MGAVTGISWTSHTFNPVVGCTKVSDGCKNCYAERDMDKRRGFAKWGPGQERVRTSAANWRQPLKWDRAAAAAGRRAQVFCASLADVFDAEWDPAVRADLMDLIGRTPNLDWQLLTKRPENVMRLLRAALDACPIVAPELPGPGLLLKWIAGLPPPNVWLGVSAEHQAALLERVPALADLPARVRFVSAEPLLGPLAFGRTLARVDWIIVGGESGPGARPFDVRWARAIVDEVEEQNLSVFGDAPRRVAVFVKQLGANAIGAGELQDRKGGDMDEWPADLRVRQMPVPR